MDLPTVPGLKYFTKKPIPVAMVQWTGDNADDLYVFTNNNFAPICPNEPRNAEGELPAGVWDVLHNTYIPLYRGWWVVRGIKGECYPIEPNVLAETYDLTPVKENTDAHQG